MRAFSLFMSESRQKRCSLAINKNCPLMIVSACRLRLSRRERKKAAKHVTSENRVTLRRNTVFKANTLSVQSFSARVNLVTAIALLMVIAGVSAQANNRTADANPGADLEALHAKWFKAFDSGDGATMDQMEMDKLTLVMPSGLIWAKTAARAGKQMDRDPRTGRALSAVAVRRFGDTAILTGILTTTSAGETSREATTVVFVWSSGKWKIASAQWTPVTEADKAQ